MCRKMARLFLRARLKNLFLLLGMKACLVNLNLLSLHSMIELNRHIEILLLDNDCVIIPNFGGFTAHYVEARKDEKDNTFLPPMRTIGFNPKLTLNDSLLAQSYVEVYDISYPDALARIADEVRELRQHLEFEGQYELNDIGVLKLNGNGAYEFDPCSAGILTPSLYALSYFEFDTISPSERPALATATATTHDEGLATATGNASRDETLTAGNAPRANVLTSRSATIWRNVAIGFAAFIAFLLIPAPLANNNGQLTTAEVNTKLLEYITPKDVTTGQEQVEANIKRLQAKPDKSFETKTNNATQTPTQEGFTIVLASKVSKKSAHAYVSDLRKRGFEDARVWSKKRRNKVVYGLYDTNTEAYNALSKLNDSKEFAEAWVMKN